MIAHIQTLEDSKVIGHKNMGYEITDSVTGRYTQDIYVTGFDSTRGRAVTWCAYRAGDNYWFYCWGHYFDSAQDGRVNYNNARADMLRRAEFGK